MSKNTFDLAIVELVQQAMQSVSVTMSVTDEIVSLNIPKWWPWLAGRIWRELCHPALPLCPSNDAEAVATERYWRELLQKTVGDFLKRNGLPTEILMVPPARADQESFSYCPHCLAQFTTRTGVCEDCGGVPLEAFPGTAPARPGRELPLAKSEREH